MRILPANLGCFLSWPGCCRERGDMPDWSVPGLPCRQARLVYIDPKLGLPGLAWGCFYIDPGQVGLCLPGSPLLSPLSLPLAHSCLSFWTEWLCYCVLQLPLSLAESLKNHEKQSAQYFGQRCSSVDQSCPIDWAQVLWSGLKQPKRLGQGVKRFGAHLVPIGTLLVPTWW